ncbi:DUF1028 domain-containing protein [Stenotrophomonas sp.]|uniref:DUF1028 domain-containing protein n=1 Tax=Stenotrophomonas sp. TaxID=69392 RepID=UPI00289BDF1E|nr:DUF1028 domain-containing protein [Stenotrophomonas sp.]
MRSMLIGTVLLLCVYALPAHATFSIAACDDEGNCGVAVATHNLAVGGSDVAWAQAKVGALASQFETNPHYGPDGLRLMAAGKPPAQVLKQLLAGDGNYDDTTVAERQVGLVDARGRQAQYTGATALVSGWAGALGGPGYSVQGNGLAGAAVLDAMRDAYLGAEGSLAARLLQALEAGEAAGGQRSGQMSAALLVRTPEGDWRDTDLRVDSAPQPIVQLRVLFEQRQAHAAMIRAEQLMRGREAEAEAALAQALSLAHGWDRIWARAARLAMARGDAVRAREYLGVLWSINPVMAGMELEGERYVGLRGDPVVEGWR